MLRVDHAGETAAVRIYEGQAAVLGRSAEGPMLAEMAAHERAHLEAFQRLLPQYRARPSLLLPVWSAAAYALGAGSGLLGREAAYAVTEAVEEVITGHYEDQLRDLASLETLAGESELRATFKAFRDDEQSHLDVAVERGAHSAPAYTVLSTVVKAGCKGAIWLAQRL
jgi:ubiquinone biosynthesis monooxygenase Coq7